MISVTIQYQDVRWHCIYQVVQFKKSLHWKNTQLICQTHSETELCSTVIFWGVPMRDVFI